MRLILLDLRYNVNTRGRGGGGMVEGGLPYPDTGSPVPHVGYIYLVLNN